MSLGEGLFAYWFGQLTNQVLRPYYYNIIDHWVSSPSWVRVGWVVPSIVGYTHILNGDDDDWSSCWSNLGHGLNNFLWTVVWVNNKVEGSFNYEIKQLPKDFIVCHCNYLHSSSAAVGRLHMSTYLHRRRSVPYPSYRTNRSSEWTRVHVFPCVNITNYVPLTESIVVVGSQFRILCPNQSQSADTGRSTMSY